MAMPSPSNLVDSTPCQIQNNTTGKRRRRAPPSPRMRSVSISDSDSSSGNSSAAPPKLSRRERKRLNAVKRLQNEDSSAALLSEDEKSRYVALDCEMVGVGYHGQQSALARVTIINWDAEIVLDCFVKPEQDVVDYRTFVSGITKEDLESEYAITMDECLWLVSDMLYNKILVGHALKNDLHVLGISHPWYDTRDTAKYEPFMKMRFDNGILWPRKLKDLTKEKLGREIQLPGNAHSAFEDALAALDLYKKNRSKWEKAMEYKMNKTRQIQNQAAPDDEIEEVLIAQQ